MWKIFELLSFDMEILKELEKTKEIFFLTLLSTSESKQPLLIEKKKNLNNSASLKINLYYIYFLYMRKKLNRETNLNNFELHNTDVTNKKIAN